jgi:orotidine-5'-phosphate decarboxylase
VSPPLSPSRPAFAELFDARVATGAHLCVGLDTSPASLPDSIDRTLSAQERVVRFNECIVDATRDIAAAFKPNAAFYEAMGSAGWEALRRSVDYIRRVAPDVPVLLDAKRADIGSTNEGYVQAVFDEVGADAVTVHPYLGEQALRPFLDRPGAGIFVLARTSNPGAGEFQDLLVDGLPLYRQVARRVAGEWTARARLGLVVGATYPRELEEIRADVPPDVPILIPGVGAQGGDLDASVRANDEAGSRAFIISVSRGIAGAAHSDDPTAGMRAAAREFDAQIRRAAA